MLDTWETGVASQTEVGSGDALAGDIANSSMAPNRLEVELITGRPFVTVRES